MGQCVLVVDDHELVRIGLRSMLARVDWVTRCVGAESSADALEMMDRYDPHVALVDLCVGDESGLDICRSLRAARPSMTVLLMSGSGRITPGVARAAGAQGFVSKDWKAGAMIEAIRLATVGRPVFTKQDSD